MEIILDILQELQPDVDFLVADGLIEEGILDSFDLATLAARIDEEFGVAIPAYALTPENFDSARSIHALVCQLREE